MSLNLRTVIRSSSIAPPNRSYAAAFLVLAAAAAVSAIAFAPPELWMLSVALGVLLVWASLIDIHRKRLPNALTYAILLLGVGAAFISPSPTLDERVIGGVAGFGAFYAVGAAYRRMKGRVGLGLGDAKLLAGAGVWLGVYMLPIIVLGASSLAIVYVLFARLRDPNALNAAIPFGPFLAINFWLMWLFGARIFEAFIAGS